MAVVSDWQLHNEGEKLAAKFSQNASNRTARVCKYTIYLTDNSVKELLKRHGITRKRCSSFQVKTLLQSEKVDRKITTEFSPNACASTVHNPFTKQQCERKPSTARTTGITSKRQWVAVASAGPYASLHLAPDRQPHQHPTTQFFTGRMPFLPPNQQRQSIEARTTGITNRYICQIGSHWEKGPFGLFTYARHLC